QASPAGPYNQWPAGQGFDHFYGFLAADADNWNPILIRDTAPIAKPEDPDYHLNDDLADRAIAMIGERDAASPAAPFFMYWATGTAHAPHHAPQAWIDRYKGKFDMGWDEMRIRTWRKQIAMGMIPADTKLTPRPEQLPAWDSLTPNQKKFHARQMEVAAAQLAYQDEQFGRIRNELERMGEADNTL
ncbi:MAG: sulfatase-like hydrolase/transferase, partial [Caldilineaceae bacterium]|nr:sulfatase-like hydrolase/transferase [Caldilineaceae bacterium]